MRGRTQIILAVVGVAVVVLLGYFFFIRSQQDELSDVRAQVDTERNRTQQLQTELQRLQDLQENAPQLQARLDRVRELVPQRNEVPNFIFQVQEASDESGVGFLQITPELPDQPPEGATLAEVTIALRGRGGYFAVQDFIRRLYDLDRALRLDVMTLTGNEDEVGGRVSVDGTVRIFFELPAGTAATTTTTTPTAPGATPSPSPTPAA
ncbi:MAG: type 4a pilus biogenesis protein PilO [Actinomycetota bacterium]